MINLLIIIKVLLLILIQFKYTSAIASCLPCICLRSYGARKADCSRNIVNYTMNQIPDFINSDIQILNLTQHNLKILKNEIFLEVNLTELTSLYLDRCNIKTIEINAFKNLTYLTDLSLMYNDIHDLEPGLFDTNLFLKYLWIENNKIKHLPNGLFNNLDNFQGLFARFNEISFVDKQLFINNEYLWMIDLSNNKLNYLNPQLIKKSNISIIFIQENPFICDCQLRDLHQIMKTRNLYNKTQPMCAFPNQLKGKELNTLKLNDFKCWLNTTINPNNQQIKIYDYNKINIQCINNALPEPETKLIHKNEIIEPTLIYQEDTRYFYNFTIKNLTANDSGLYKCISNNKIYNSSSSNINITIIKTEKPTINIYQPTKSMIFLREIYNLTLSCQYTGIPKPSVYWKYNNTEITPSYLYNLKHDSNNFWLNLTITVLNYKNQGTYGCTAQNNRQSVEKNIEIFVSPSFEPNITIIGEETIEEGDNVTLSCFIETYSTPVVVSWLIKNKTHSTEIFNNQILWNNLTINNATIKDIGIYECAVSTKESNKTSQHNLNILVKHLKLEIDAMRENHNIKIWCQIFGYPEPIIEWFYGNDTYKIKIINNITKYNLVTSKIKNDEYSSNLTIYNINYNDMGMYFCAANNTKQNISKYFVLNFYQSLESHYTYCYIIAAVVIIFIVTICIMKMYLKYKRKTEIFQETSFSSNKLTSDSKATSEIPMVELSNENLKTDETDIMFTLDRELTTYTLRDNNK